MKIFKTHKKLAVSSLALVVAIMAGGAAYAFWTSPGSGTGSAQTGSTSPLLIDQLGGTPMYNSTIDPSAYQASQCFYCVQMGDFGNKITFAGGTGGPLSDVVVAMANFGGVATTMDMTLNIYQPGTYSGPGSAPGTLIGTDKQTFSIPAGPNGGNGSTYCQTGAGASDPYCGIANFNVTFDFSSQNLTLPGTVVYDIQYNDAATLDNGGINVQVVNEASQISVGTDTAPGYLFASLASLTPNGYNNGYNDVGPGEITCDTVSQTFGEYPTANCLSNTQGEAPYIPAVEFDSSTLSDLYPGGPAQPINFSITNPGSVPATVNSVTITVTGTSQNAACNTTNFAMRGGDDVSGTAASTTYTAGFPATIPAGATVDFLEPATGANLYMINLPVNQNGCQNVTVDLGFASS